MSLAVWLIARGVDPAALRSAAATPAMQTLLSAAWKRRHAVCVSRG